jgi:hypothetical protein
MDKKYWGEVFFLAMIIPYLGLRLVGQGIAWLWKELGEITDDSLLMRGGIITSAITAYGHWFMEPWGFMTTQWQFMVALAALGFGFTTLLVVTIIIGEAIAKWVATFRYGPAFLATIALGSLGIIGLLEVPETPFNLAIFLVTVGLPGLLALVAAGYQYTLWGYGDEDEDEEEFVDDGELTP